MPSTNPDLSFRRIRSWEGSKHRAFEEICYQLLREPEDLPPGGAPTIRCGIPDGGVEWYANLPDGTQWGWQAKYTWDIETLVSGMTKSVSTVTSERPALRRLTFCIPFDLGSGTQGRTRKSQRERYEAAVERLRGDIPGASVIEFLLVQQSDLVDRLSRPKHAGRRTFWWNETWLGADQLRRLYEQQSAVAGARYRPDLQVDLPIERELEALGFSDSFFRALEGHSASLLRTAKWFDRPIGALGPEVEKLSAASLQPLQDLLHRLLSLAPLASEADPLAALIEGAQAARDALNAVLDLAHRQEGERLAAIAPGNPGARQQILDGNRRVLWDTHRLVDAVLDLLQFLDSPASHALRSRVYFLTGIAGSGKTHLLLDAVRRALDEGRPAAVLFGGQLGPELWSRVAAQLGLPPIGRDELLGALDACAEACTSRGRRFVLAVDAINDTNPLTFWKEHLPALRAVILQWPHLALVVSCRDTYLQAVDPEDRHKEEYTCRAHPGFSGREVEASERLFAHYGLSPPRIPLLLPDFTNPLFLQMYCESLKDAGLQAPEQHHESRLTVFGRFRSAKLKRVAARVMPGRTALGLEVTQKDAEAVLDAVLDELIVAGRESLPLQDAIDLAGAVPLRCGARPLEVLEAFVSEGVLQQEPVYRDGTSTQGLRVTFQAFSDHVILRRRLERVPPKDVATDDQLRAWLFHASAGIREAAAVVLPEVHGVELPDILATEVKTSTSASERFRAKYERQHLVHLFIQGLPHRSRESITERTIGLLNDALPAGEVDPSELFQVLFSLAAQPGHRLNADGLHRYLMQRSLPRRDAGFGQATYSALEEEVSAAVRLARWAARGPHQDYDDEVVELAAIPLVWLFSSPNRFMRDWLTKACVQLLGGHPDVLLRLLERFRGVNDPYVWERLVMVAYGAVLRARPEQEAALRSVAEFVRDRIFGEVTTLAPDALMLDAARGIVEWAVARSLLGEDAALHAQPPYGFARPGRTWSAETIEKRFNPPPEEDRPGHSFYTIYGSLLAFVADFGTYIVAPAVSRFSNVPLDKPLPASAPDGPSALVPSMSRWKRFVRSLDPQQRRSLDGLGTPSPLVRFLHHDEPFWTSLNDMQRQLFEEAWRGTRGPVRARRPRTTRRKPAGGSSSGSSVWAGNPSSLTSSTASSATSMAEAGTSASASARSTSGSRFMSCSQESRTTITWTVPKGTCHRPRS